VDDTPWQQPAALHAILADAAELGFAMSCEPRTGSLLATLAASKPGGHILELGTGVGAGAAWLLHGMGSGSRLLSVEADPKVQAVAARHLGSDKRVTFEITDADAWLDAYGGPRFSLAYVDCRPGKFHRLDDLVHLLEPGGLYVGDDLLPQATWPTDHQERVDGFLQRMPHHPDLLATPMRWASGLVVASRT
jgi:predicted O-methyltransferase YrrM